MANGEEGMRLKIGVEGDDHSGGATTSSGGKLGLAVAVSVRYTSRYRRFSAVVRIRGEGWRGCASPGGYDWGSGVARGGLGVAKIGGPEGTVRVRPRVVADEYWRWRRDGVEMEAAWGRGFGRVMVWLEPGPLDGEQFDEVVTWLGESSMLAEEMTRDGGAEAPVDGENDETIETVIDGYNDNTTEEEE
ncbi:unnamed protein product [Sphenostylis stenocarpa]|uniref:Uncharacterized protein n=1 Tax=Sphenostylis stenocarpa TaxID=92480 RepID=A0AA86VR20_9FABA|nr:unnamed protein product [Sphenostylis stenocarpa]